MTLHAIRKTREKMYFGITEAQTRTILEKEMAKTGLVGGDGLVLFGGTSHIRKEKLTSRKRSHTPWRRNEPKVGKGRYDPH
jgi:hypothetical protein